MLHSERITQQSPNTDSAHGEVRGGFLHDDYTRWHLCCTCGFLLFAFFVLFSGLFITKHPSAIKIPPLHKSAILNWDSPPPTLSWLLSIQLISQPCSQLRSRLSEQWAAHSHGLDMIPVQITLTCHRGTLARLGPTERDGSLIFVFLRCFHRATGQAISVMPH